MPSVFVYIKVIVQLYFISCISFNQNYSPN